MAGVAQRAFDTLSVLRNLHQFPGVEGTAAPIRQMGMLVVSDRGVDFGLTKSVPGKMQIFFCQQGLV